MGLQVEWYNMEYNLLQQMLRYLFPSLMTVDRPHYSAQEVSSVFISGAKRTALENRFDRKRAKREKTHVVSLIPPHPSNGSSFLAPASSSGKPSTPFIAVCSDQSDLSLISSRTFRGLSSFCR